MRLILFSGLGADGRLFRELRCPGLSLVTPPHIDPEEGESLPAYARRLADRLGIGAADAVGGASFGGFIAAEIAAQRPCAGLVLIGSALSPRGIPAALSIVAKLSNRVSDVALRKAFQVDPSLVSLVEPLPQPHRELLMDMFRNASMALLRRGANMIFHWKGVKKPPCPVHRIHGAKDRVICARPAEVDEMVKGGGHLLTFSHPERVSRFIVTRLEGGRG